MDKATAFFGTPPRLMRGLSDTTGVLSSGESRAIRRSIREFERRFPQLGFTAALLELPRDTPGPTYTWWVFNRCNPAGELVQASANRHIFLLINTAGGSGAWITCGYGLEPFVGELQWQECLDKVQPHFALGQYGPGIIALLSEIGTMLRTVVADLPRVFGLFQQPQITPLPETKGPPAWSQ